MLLAQARLRWKQCKQVLAAVQGIAPADLLQTLKGQAAEANAALDRIKPPGKRAEQLPEWHADTVELR